MAEADVGYHSARSTPVMGATRQYGFLWKVVFMADRPLRETLGQVRPQLSFLTLSPGGAQCLISVRESSKF